MFTVYGMSDPGNCYEVRLALLASLPSQLIALAVAMIFDSIITGRQYARAGIKVD